MQLRHFGTTIGLFTLGLAAAIALSAGAPRAQQHSYTPQDIDAGRQLYDANCGRCHNDDGAGVPGTSLFTQIRRATSDDETAQLIITGIPNSTMPPHQFSPQQAMTVVAYLRTAASGGAAAAGPAAAGSEPALPGDPARGKTLVETNGCLNCHQVGSAGGGSGPELTAIAAPARGGRGFAPAPTAATFERALLDPDADVAPRFRVFKVVTRGGQTVRGTILNQDTFSVQLRDQAGELRAFQKSDLTEFGFEPSAMPSYRGRLSSQQLSDIVSYLLTLKG